MAKKKKKRVFPGPWRRRESEIARYELHPRRGKIDIRAVVKVTYCRTVDRWGHKDYRTEYELGPYLDQALEKVHLSDRQSGLLMLMEGALATVDRVFERYNYFLRRREERATQLRRIAYRKRRAEIAQEREDKDVRKKAREGHFMRRIEA